MPQTEVRHSTEHFLQQLHYQGSRNLCVHDCLFFYLTFIFVRIINSWKSCSFNFGKCSIHKMNVCSYRHNMWFLIQNLNKNFFDACLQFWYSLEKSSIKKYSLYIIPYTLRHRTTLLIFSQFVVTSPRSVTVQFLSLKFIWMEYFIQ